MCLGWEVPEGLHLPVRCLASHILIQLGSSTSVPKLGGSEAGGDLKKTSLRPCFSNISCFPKSNKLFYVNILNQSTKINKVLP